jgi:hypothetical protein
LVGCLLFGNPTFIRNDDQAGRVLACFIIWPTATFSYTTKAEGLRNKTFGKFTVHIITRKRLNDFADLYPETATALEQLV